MISITLPTKIVSIANLRLHWAAKARIAKTHRQAAKTALQAAAPMGAGAAPLTVVLTRLAPRKLDTDNLASAFKATRDGVADWLGMDDGSELIDWQYQQRTAGAKVYGVEIEVIA